MQSRHGETNQKDQELIKFKLSLKSGLLSPGRSK